jgi:hypothetical protein
MKLEDGYWIDDNDNRWNSKLYSEEESIKASETLIDCKNCENCNNCKDCNNCENCNNCE